MLCQKGLTLNRGQMQERGLIYDFDGVIGDSEALANTVLAETITRLGRPTTLEGALDRYMGKRWPEVIALIESDLGRELPHSFPDDLELATLERFRAGLREVQGASSFIRHFGDVPRCIASSSSLDRLHTCLHVLGLANEFGSRIYSADLVERGKPYPDIFLLAAQELKIAPSNCIVIEDSSSGVSAGVAAGMMVVGLCAGSHLRPGHAQRLTAAGASFTASTWSEALEIVEHALKNGILA
jgi:beta-phosphoglucomutase-like phosphatase (HAD superfamily)